MHYIAVDFFKDFECVADSCPSTCCAGWTITIDEATRKKMIDKEDILGIPAREWLIEKDGRVMAKLNNGRCCMLNDRNLCEVVLKLGPEYLSHTCTAYPRIIRKYGDVQEIYLTLSCPEVIKKLMSCSYVDFDFGEDDLPGENFEHKELYLFESIVRNELMAVIQGYSNFSLVTRLFVCYQILEIALKLYNNNCLDFEEFDRVISLYCNESNLSAYESQLQSMQMEEQRYTFLKSLKNVLKTSDSSAPKESGYEKFVSYFEKTDYQTYLSDLGHFRERMKEYEDFWSKYLTYRMFSEFISLPDFNGARTNLLYIAAEFCLIQAIALANYADNQGVLTEEEYILIISYLSRIMEHNKSFHTNLAKNMEEQGVVNLAGLLLMTFV